MNTIDHSNSTETIPVLYFQTLPGDATLFQPLLPVAEVWLGDPGRNEGQSLGLVYRTYRNSPAYTPGEPVWIYRDDEAGKNFESFHSEANLRDQIIAHYGGAPLLPKKESTHQVWEAAVIMVGLPRTLAEHETVTEGIKAVLDRHFDGYTIVPSQGHFRGENEPALAIYLTPGDGAILPKVASEIRTLLGQDGVGIFFRGKYLRVTKDAVGRTDRVDR